MIPDQLVKSLIEALEDVKAQDIRVLDVRKLTAITDYMLIVTGSSDRHVKALARAAVDHAKQIGHRPRGVEGEVEGEWVLVDLVDVVVHVMQSRTRALYQLEKLWDISAERPDQQLDSDTDTKQSAAPSA